MEAAREWKAIAALGYTGDSRGLSQDTYRQTRRCHLVKRPFPHGLPGWIYFSVVGQATIQGPHVAGASVRAPGVAARAWLALDGNTPKSIVSARDSA